jgi:hypothetical protein
MSASNTSVANTPVMEQEIVTTGTPVLEDYIKAKTNLAAKYAKFIQFGYFLLTKINSGLDTPLIDENLLFNSIHLFNTIDNQEAFVNEFLTSSKEINKTLRKTVVQHKKKLAKDNLPPKVKKERKPRVKPVVEVDESNPPVEKKGKGKKAKVVTQEDDLVNSLVQLAINGRETEVPPTTPSLLTQPIVVPPSEPVTLPPTEPVTIPSTEPVTVPSTEPVTVPPTEPVKKTKKPKENKEEKKEVKKEEKKEVKKEEKKKGKKEEIKEEKKEETKEDSNDDQLEVSVFVYDDKQYLIDDNNDVYDFDSHDKIGTFSNGTLSLI